MATQHISRDPDHVPHDVIGMLALSIVFIALLTGVTWMVFGGTAAVLVLAAIGIWRIASLSRRAKEERIEDDLHPERRIDKPVDPHDRSIS